MTQELLDQVIVFEKKKKHFAKWLSEGVLQRAEKRRGAGGIGEKERYATEGRVPGNSRRDKKALLSEQCKEIEESNRNGKDWRSCQEN